jgi:hypothetical protein
MKHVSTRAVFEHWDRQRAGRAAPERDDIDPVAIRRALGDTFLLTADFADHLRFRLAGTRVCALFGRELKGEAFNALWSRHSRQTVDDLLQVVTTEASGVVAGVTGLTEDGVTTDIEMLLLPIAYSRRARVCVLGVMTPLATPFWLGARLVTELELTIVRHLGPLEKARSVPAFGQPAETGRLRHGFVVYSGGRENPSGDRTG